MNVIYDIKLGEPTGSEPVTLAEVKSQVRQSSTADDDLITALIGASRAQVEQYTGVTLVERQVDVIVHIDGFTEFELPYGPIVDLTSVTALKVSAGGSDTVLDSDDYVLYGNDFISITPSNGCGKYAVTYDAGWSTVPYALKQAVLHQACYLYEHRGDEDEIGGLSPTARVLAKAYRRSPV